MKEENNVLHLANYINRQEDIVTVDDSYKEKNLSEPSGHLLKRMVALFIDIMVISLIRSGLHIAYAVFINEVMAPVSLAKRSELAMGSTGLHLMTFVLVYTAYFLYTTFILDGKTIGKITMKLRVINESYIHDRNQEDYSLDLNSSAKRAVGYLLCFLSFGVFFIFNFSSEDKRGLADYLSGSRTVSEEWLTSFKEFKTHEHEHVFIDIQDLDQVA